MSQRIKKVNELLRHLVAEGIKEAGVEGFITVKAIETTRNMKNADVWISIIDEEEGAILDSLEENRPYIQRFVAKQITARNVPVLRFRIDHSGEHAAKIEELLNGSREG